MLELLRELFWGWHVLGLILAVGMEYSFSTAFFQLRRFSEWLGSPFRKKERGEGISGFQALTAALGGSIGTGNIVGVAAAITVGGPGAIFWMWVSALLGMMTVFAENALSAAFPKSAGALGYIERAGRMGKGFARMYALGCVLSSLAMGNLIQTNSMAASLEELGVPAVVCAAALVPVLFLVARGGLRAGVKITEKLVPFMTLLFFSAALLVLWVFRENLPAAFSSIFREAFSLRTGASGGCAMLLAMKTGISRGVFTNEAGLGSSAFAYGEVRGKSPRELGCLGIFQVFLDTIVMCTLTGLVILCCRSPMLEGAQLTFYAFESALGSWGSGIVSLCTALFALATTVAWCCYGREGLSYLTGGRGKNIYAAVCAAVGGAGCFAPLSAAFAVGDICNGLMAIPNVLALFYFAHRFQKICDMRLTAPPPA